MEEETINAPLFVSTDYFGYKKETGTNFWQCNSKQMESPV